MPNAVLQPGPDIEGDGIYVPYKAIFLPPPPTLVISAHVIIMSLKTIMMMPASHYYFCFVVCCASGSGSGRSKLYQDMMHFLDLTANQDVVEQDTESSEDAPDYQDTLTYMQDTDRTNQDAKNFQDTLSKHQDTSKYQDTVYQQVITNIQDSSSSKLKLIVGVVTQDAHLSRTMQVTMDTWGQSLRNLTFFSFGGSVEDIKEEEEDKWAWHDPRSTFVRSRNKQIERVIRLKEKKATSSLKLLPRGSLEAIQVLQHTQINLMDQFDWFILVPEDVYVQLDKLESVLQESDPNMAIMLSRTDPETIATTTSHGLSGCGLGRGVVLSRRYFWELKGRMETLVESGACSKGRLLWRCIYRHMVERDGGFNCFHSEKVQFFFISKYFYTWNIQ